jgi:demethylmenaquinone methyltransferase/2-methoxy-6-polyprenyl-1,4-benzoquinol methylase
LEEIIKDPAVMKELFSNISQRYDRLNTMMSFGLHHYWRRYAVAQTGLKPGATALDVCCGTGFITEELIKKTRPNGNVIGFDLAPGMLKIARRKLESSRFTGMFRLAQGDARTLPFPDNVFDGAVIGYGLRNVPDPLTVLKEMHRVVKPGRKIVALEMTLPRGPIFKKLYRLYLAKAVPRFGKWFAQNGPAYQYLYRSIIQFCGETDLTELFQASGLTQIKCRPLTWGVVAVYDGVKPGPQFLPEDAKNPEFSRQTPWRRS